MNDFKQAVRKTESGQALLSARSAQLAAGE